MSQCLCSTINENYLWHPGAIPVPHTSQEHTVHTHIQSDTLKYCTEVCVVVLTAESPAWRGCWPGSCGALF